MLAGGFLKFYRLSLCFSVKLFMMKPARGSGRASTRGPKGAAERKMHKPQVRQVNLLLFLLFILLLQSFIEHLYDTAHNK